MNFIFICISLHFSLGNEELEVPEAEMLLLQLFWTCHGTQSSCKTWAFANIIQNLPLNPVKIILKYL